MRRQAIALVLAAAAGIPAMAGELVLFVDGRYLEVRSHEVAGEAIRLAVTRDSFVVVPRSRVERIRDDRRAVWAAPRPAGPEPAVGEAETAAVPVPPPAPAVSIAARRDR